MADEDSAVLASAEQRVGTVLNGKYRIERVIGVGGMATVYAATHRNRKRFAIKILHPEYAVRSDMRKRFVREGYVANSVAHPGVVAALDDDVDEAGSPFLVMELLEGANVEALSAVGPLRLEDALRVTEDVLDILESAHQKGVIHRDIKPANLFLQSDGTLKILDFGIARLREAESALKSTQTGATLGTPAFMAPEQARGDTHAVDTRTDVWAVGATLFTLLAARYVHSGQNARQIMIDAATKPAPALAEVAPHVPAQIADVVSRALMFEPEARFQSAGAMRDALLAARRELFGDPARHELHALLEERGAALGNLPTEPSPEARESAARPTSPERPLGDSAARPTPQHVSKGSKRLDAVSARRLVIPFASLLAFGTLTVLLRPGSRSFGVAQGGAPATGRLVPIALSSEPTRIRAASASPIAADTATVTTPATVSSSAALTEGATPPAPSSARGTRARRDTKARAELQLPTPALPVVPTAAASQSPPARAENPLLLELQ